MKKRILSLLLCLVMVLSLMRTVAFAEDTGYTLDSEGNLTITSNAGVTNWNTEISDKSVIKTLTAKADVTTQLTESMGFDSNLTNLQTITFEGDADLTNGAFRNCLKVESVTFKGNAKLTSSAFNGCTALKTLTFESTSEIINSGVTGCSALETMTFGGLTHIGYGALSGTGTTTLKELVFPEGSLLEPHGVFNNYTGLESITFEGDITLGGSAFSRLDNLKNVVFNGKSTLKESAFSNCPKLESVTFEDETHVGSGSLICSSEAPNTVLTEVEVPDNSTMSENAFAYYTALKTVKLGKGAYFYNGAFYGADGITDVYFADKTPVTFPEKALVYLNPAQVTLHVPTCDAVTAYTEELKKDPVDEADADLHNAAFVSCLVADAHNYGVWTSVSETQHQRVCADNATHTETANHTFSGNTCTVCGYAKWTDIKTDDCGGDKSRCPSAPYTDVAEYGNWAHAGIDYCIRNGLMNGISADTFDPKGSMTRAMVVTVLWRQAGSPAPSKPAAFDDLTQSWYMDAVAWAAENGVVNGVGGTRFAPGDPVTREQMATILQRYTANILKKDTAKTTDISGYPDFASVSSFAVTPMAWANAEGLITGTSSNGMTFLNPKVGATREQVATILMRFVQNIA